MTFWVWSEQRTSEFDCYIWIIYSTYFYSTLMWHTGCTWRLHVMTQINNTKQKQFQWHNQLFVVAEEVMEQNFLRAIITTPALIIHPSALLRCQTGPNTSHAVTTRVSGGASPHLAIGWMRKMKQGLVTGMSNRTTKSVLCGIIKQILARSSLHQNIIQDHWTSMGAISFTPCEKSNLPCTDFYETHKCWIFL